MMENGNLSSQLEQIFTQFSSCLQGVASTVTQIKGLVYSLIDISLPLVSPCKISADYRSIMMGCKRIHDDLKRTVSILTGHARARSIFEQLDIPKIEHNHKNIDGQFQLKRITKSQIIKVNEETNVLHRTDSQKFGFASIEIKRVDQNGRKTQARLLQNVDYQLAIDQEYTNDELQQCPSEQTLDLNSREFQIQSRIQGLRRKKEQDLRQFVTENQRCINLIKRIREGFILKKGRKKAIQ